MAPSPGPTRRSSRLRRSHATGPARGFRRVVVALAACILVAAVLPPAARAQDGGGTDPGAGSGDDSGSDQGGGERSVTAASQPTGQVAYVTASGEVLVGIGEAEPLQIGAFAALGPTGQGAVAISPTAEAVAYVRSDGTLVTVPIEGGDPTVLATDVALDAVGREPVMAWDSTGDALAYVAVGTEDQVVDRSVETPSLDPGTFAAPLPSGVLGNVARVVQANGQVGPAIGDPSVRSILGVNWSPSDPFILLDSAIPGSDDRYTLSVATGTSTEAVPTPLSVDDPEFAPDGSFVVAVGPSKGRQELLWITLDDLDHTTLAIDDRICNPTVSPDSSRIVYGGGPDCSRLMLVSSKGGRAFDITPLDSPDTATYGETELGWTADGRFVTYPDCQLEPSAGSGSGGSGAGDPVSRCAGATKFLEPDTGRVLDGPAAITISPIERPLVQDIWLDIQMRGPLEFEHSFLISPETQGSLTDTESGGILEAEMTDGATVMTVRFMASESMFVTGTIDIADAEAGIDRTFMVLGRPSILGVRIVSMTGIWISTNDMPFATGELNMAIRRR